ncbi:MAG: hypothetical protein ACC644_05890 [Candidatus Hydrothermarchaeales archaeon]
MEEIRIGIMGGGYECKTQLIKNILKNTEVDFNDAGEWMDLGVTVSNQRRLHLYASLEKHVKKRYAAPPGGLDAGVFVVDSKVGVSKNDHTAISTVKHEMPCIILFDDRKTAEFNSFGNSIVCGSLVRADFAERLIDFLGRINC